MNSLRTRLLLGVLGCALIVVQPSHAQGGGRPGGGSPGGGGQGMPGGSAGSPGGLGTQPGMHPGVGGMTNNAGRSGIPPSANSGRGLGVPGEGSASMATGPAGRWWDNKHYSSALGLRPEQRRRMDAIFNGNRGELTDKVQTLRQEESKLESATRDTHLSQESIFGQMDRVAQARDALEKVNRRLMESLKKELDQDQASRIQTLK